MKGRKKINTIDLHDLIYQNLNTYCKIPSNEFDKFFKIGALQEYRKDSYFVAAGEKNDSFGFVLKGLFRFFYTNDEGYEFNKSFCAEGEFIASYGALLKDAYSLLSIQALEASTVFQIDFKRYLELQQGHGCWQIVSKVMAEQLYLKKEERERQFLLDKADKRYMSFLQEYPDIEERIKQYHIASYLGITSVALSRIRKNLGKLT